MKDALKSVIAAVVAELIPNRRFFAAVEYRISDASGGTFSADPANPSDGYPPITNAPIRCLASSNVASKLAPGASVLVGWIAGDRARPYLVDVLEDVLELAINATVKATLAAPAVGINGAATVDVVGASITLNHGVQPVARVGDLVMGIFPITSGNPTVKA